MTYNYANITNPQFQSGYPNPHAVQRATTTAPHQLGVVTQKTNARLQNLEQDLLVKIQEQEQEEIKEKKENKKRGWKALGLTAATVIGLAVLGNKSSNTMAELGQKVDDFLVNKKWYQNFEKGCTNLKSKVKNFFLKNNNKFVRETSEDIFQTYGTRHATNKLKIANSYGRGFESIFSLTPPDVMQQALTNVQKEDPAKAVKSIEKLVGKEKAQAFYDKLFGGAGIEDNRIFCKELTDAIAEHFGARKDGVTDTKKLLKVFKDIQTGTINGVDVSEFTNVRMDKGQGILGSLMSNWSSVNLIDSIGNKFAQLRGKPWKGFCRGNLGDAMVKVTAVNGSLAKTGAGSFVQKCITVPTESISNFVNDKSNVGIGLSAMIFMLYKNMLKAPEDKKAATVADDFIGTIGSIAISMPLAFGATYKLATLGNLEGKTWLTKALKAPGKIFNLGLKQYGKDGKVLEEGAKTFGKTFKNGCGHVLRFALIMGVFASLFGKPISALIHKIFGKPYDSTEDDARKAQEKQLKQQEIEALTAQYLQESGQIPQMMPA